MTILQKYIPTISTSLGKPDAGKPPVRNSWTLRTATFFSIQEEHFDQ